MNSQIAKARITEGESESEEEEGEEGEEGTVRGRGGWMMKMTPTVHTTGGKRTGSMRWCVDSGLGIMVAGRFRK